MIKRLLVCFCLAVSVRAHGQDVCTIPALPEPRANNAVALWPGPDPSGPKGEQDGVAGGARLYSFMGLGAGKTWKAVSRQAYVLEAGAHSWRRLGDVPVETGRLAATAAAVAGKIYLFGGYTVARDGAEKSMPEVFAFDPVTETYERRADMPIPVDDSVSLVYRDRYVYFVSGWHDVGNVVHTQVYDAAEDRWFRATNWPGKPVFGHAGGIVGNRMLVAGGVAVVGVDADGRRQFAPYAQAWTGAIDAEDPAAIVWTPVPPMPEGPVYRAAAAGDTRTGLIYVAGGSRTAYNYDGQGYNGTPAVPTAQVMAWNMPTGQWRRLADKPLATMDHRGLLAYGGGWVTVGGMTDGQTVTGAVVPLDNGGASCQ
ncbi:Kelch repeat-containing protein [Eilatimonas milleporae]|uniref:N-acetylneuraminic acid mutarotase n=1 Tax=Eilatimonas milleporae TaxID=911205 RepID=A0A3M0CRS2_9PROT|nr:galactose oxidase [Eilatimonas milleporae]RMB12192.1 N-acetylneuraminic acid mutarotase [Eilatimonas milleporae]